MLYGRCPTNSGGPIQGVVGSVCTGCEHPYLNLCSPSSGMCSKEMSVDAECRVWRNARDHHCVHHWLDRAVLGRSNQALDRGHLLGCECQPAGVGGDASSEGQPSGHRTPADRRERRLDCISPSTIWKLTISRAGMSRMS